MLLDIIYDQKSYKESKRDIKVERDQLKLNITIRNRIKS